MHVQAIGCDLLPGELGFVEVPGLQQGEGQAALSRPRPTGLQLCYMLGAVRGRAHGDKCAKASLKAMKDKLVSR